MTKVHKAILVVRTATTDDAGGSNLSTMPQLELIETIGTYPPDKNKPNEKGSGKYFDFKNYPGEQDFRAGGCIVYEFDLGTKAEDNYYFDSDGLKAVIHWKSSDGWEPDLVTLVVYNDSKKPYAVVATFDVPWNKGSFSTSSSEGKTHHALTSVN